ncbi:2-amino-4,5-dihydroxy-6-one-heptanoic acid-7-phosphate synthase [Kineosporia sp. J2-2]|uniref:2-amino-4,5-dihydroxy-6-one-heptanoic acid-7-phosphate synthase n=1 Tax=Kineosporia corallincola TaxID=2835133 RepID=A0ABS5TRD0_9ACTN|nr:2-amino-3,7-dideoxy-D-threo-hept-6-ulosonate synthase [Kineosporia corallincola]MBT0773355.1 2-amino-4,5-dihydroxy-6-one-heptanoic acid-7-phosphate synthase [Kineosporia corallincola]
MKDLRLRRILHPGTGRTVICPMDHGVALGPIAGLTDLEAAVALIRDHVDAVVVHKGQVAAIARQLASSPGIAVIVHLNASVEGSPSHPGKVLVASVEEALSLGADAVSVQLNLGCPGDDEMLRSVGQVVRESQLLGVPVLTMTYPQGPGLRADSVADVAHVARVAAELGSDLIKVSVPPEEDAVARIVAGVGVPVVVSGGPRRPDPAPVLRSVQSAVAAGARGIALGRNVFQHPDPGWMAARLRAVVHDLPGARADAVLDVGAHRVLAHP